MLTLSEIFLQDDEIELGLSIRHLRNGKETGSR